MTDEEDESGIPLFQQVVFGIILASCVVSNGAIVVRLINSNWKQFKPLNVYQINYFSGLTLVTLTGMILVLSSKNEESVGKICPALILSYFLNINYIYDIVILQLDRLLAVNKPLRYKSKVDAAIAVRVVAFSKLFSFSIAIISSIIDPVFIYCPACEFCIYVHSVNVYTVAYPSLGAFILTVAVSVYVSIIANRLNSIQPMVIIPLQGQRINVIHLRDNGSTPMPEDHSTIASETSEGSLQNQNILNHTEIFGESSMDKCRNAKTLDEMSITNLARQIEQRKTEGRDSRNLKKETSPSSLTNENNTNTGGYRKMLKRTLKMNLLTLSLLFILLPIQILTIKYENCNDLQGGCDTYFRSMLVISVLQICVGFLHPLVVLIILEQQ